MIVKKISLFLIILTLLISGFYWFQVRPTQIKHDCSWVKKHSEAIPARKGMTKEELQTKGLLKDCPPELKPKLLEDFAANRNEIMCSYDNATIIEDNKPLPYTPAKDWWVKATKEEYQFCLHDKGL